MNNSFRDGLQFAWDATSISKAQTCFRLYYFEMIEGWHPKGLNANLRFGQHYATALEHYYKLQWEGMDAEDALVEVVWEALRDTWDRPQFVDYSKGVPITGQELPPGQPWQSGDNAKSRENLIRSIVWYVEHFAADPLPLITLADGKPAVEYSFILPVDDGLVFSGHIDRLVLYGGEPFVMDQKTTKQTIGPYYWDQFKPHTQFSMYTFAGQAIYGNPVKGVVIDAAQIAVGFTRFERNFTHRTQDELNEWYDNSMQWITQVHAVMKTEGPEGLYRRANPASCHNFGGCRFRGVCSKSPDVRDNFLRADFDKGETWDPMRRR